jgi:hypothetical protein
MRELTVVSLSSSTGYHSLGMESLGNLSLLNLPFQYEGEINIKTCFSGFISQYRNVVPLTLSFVGWINRSIVYSPAPFHGDWNESIPYPKKLLSTENRDPRLISFNQFNFVAVNILK